MTKNTAEGIGNIFLLGKVTYNPNIITDPCEILLFSLYIKSTIAVFKMLKQISSKENEGHPLCQQGNYQG